MVQLDQQYSHAQDIEIRVMDLSTRFDTHIRHSQLHAKPFVPEQVDVTVKYTQDDTARQMWQQPLLRATHLRLIRLKSACRTSAEQGTPLCCVVATQFLHFAVNVQLYNDHRTVQNGV